MCEEEGGSIAAHPCIGIRALLEGHAHGLDVPGIDRRKHLGGRRHGLRRGGGCLLLAAGSSDQQDANEQSNRRHGGSLSFRGNGAHQFLRGRRSEEHTSELQSLMRISFAVFCLQKNTTVLYILFL